MSQMGYAMLAAGCLQWIMAFGFVMRKRIMKNDPRFPPLYMQAYILFMWGIVFFVIAITKGSL